MSKKRRREQPAVDSHLVEIYEDLASVHEDVRLKAANTLLTNFVADGKSSGDQLIEILRRLIRGLCSGRKAARLGFSVALTEFLTIFFGPRRWNVPEFQNVSQLIETLRKQTHSGSNVSSQEDRDHQFGLLFGADAIIKSGALFQSDAAFSSAAEVLEIIYELAKKKPWLQEECGFVLYRSIQNLGTHGFSVNFAQLVIDRLHSNVLCKTPEGVAIWIELQSKCLSVKFPSGVWNRDSPLDRKEKSRLAKTLEEVSTTDSTGNVAEEGSAQKGSWVANLHFAWDTILNELLEGKMSTTSKSIETSKRVSFEDFWQECIDGHLFAASSSKERKYWGFSLFQRVIAVIPEYLISTILSQNLMRCLKNQLASSERFLHRIAEKSRKAILEKARSDSGARASTLEALLCLPNGDLNFDAVSKTKTVETLLSEMDDRSYERILLVYDNLILQPGIQDEKLAGSRRQIAADQLVSAVRSMQGLSHEDGSSVESAGTIRGILELFAKYAYFDRKAVANDDSLAPNPPITGASRQIFRSRVTSCMTHLVAKSKASGKFAFKLLLYIRECEKTSENGRSLLEVDGNVCRILTEGWDELVYINSRERCVDAVEEGYYRASELLLALTILQVYNGDADAVSMLDELNNCYPQDQMNSHKNGARYASATLVEILLSLVAKPSQLFRRLGQQVFSACSSDVDVAGLQSTIKVLETKESLAGRAEMFDQDESANEEEDEVGNSKGSHGEEIEVEDAQSSNSPDQDEDTTGDDLGDSASDSTTDDDQADDADNELAAFDAKLAQALGTRSAANGAGSGDEESLSDEDMNDEQMEAIEEHLENIFRESKKVASKSTEKKDAKETIVNFKCRVLELLEIYVKQQHSTVLALSLLLPLLSLVRTTTSPLVVTKACNVVREYSRLCKGNGVPEIGNADTTIVLLDSVHSEASRGDSNAHASACSQASLLLVKVLVAHDRECLRRVVGIYGATQEKFLLDKGCKVKLGMFTDWLNWCSSAKR